MSEALNGGALDDTTVEQVVRLVESLDRSTFDPRSGNRGFSLNLKKTLC